MDTEVERQFRQSLMDALAARLSHGDGTLSRADLTEFPLGDRSWRLIDQSRGIWNPKSLAATLSIVSSPSGPYADKELAPGVWRHDYRAGSVAGDNTKLRRARELELLRDPAPPRRPSAGMPSGWCANGCISRSFAAWSCGRTRSAARCAT